MRRVRFTTDGIDSSFPTISKAHKREQPAESELNTSGSTICSTTEELNSKPVYNIPIDQFMYHVNIGFSGRRILSKREVSYKWLKSQARKYAV
jgi:hypothetical protein